ncbi:MAG: ABC transporter substrate-binding protein [Lachnospiraceae bacterium]|nr:ABC transporter substrate-binding protein [Lachnospiraceae bacterium]
MKKFLSIVVASAMVAATLAGCGGASASDSTAETTENSASTEAAEGGASAEGATFKIGGIGPVTGGAAVYGQAVKNAAQLAVDEINAAGGINGAQIEFNFQDDEHDAEKAVNAYNTLKDWNMQMLLGTVTSTPCVAVVEKSHEDNMFQLTPSGSAVESIQYDNAFRVCFSDPNQGKASAQYIGENKVAEKIAVIYNSSDVYSSGIYQTFAAEAANQGLDIVSAEAFTEDSKTDFSVQLQKAKDAGAELVFLPIYYTEASIILGQADKMGYAPMFFGCDGLDGILAVEDFDTSLAEGVMLLTPFAADAQDELTQNFVKAYQEAYGDIPNQFAADAYDGIYAIKAAAEKAGITPDMSASDICDAMKAAMTEITVDGLTGAGMTWGADGEPNKAPKAVKITNGAYAAM